MSAVKPLCVAAVQMVSGQNFTDNYQRVERLVGDAQQRGAQLVVLPECCISYGAKSGVGHEQQAHFLTWMSSLAKRLEIWLVAGTFPLGQDATPSSDLAAETVGPDTGAKPYAACLIFDPAGRVGSRYNKIHLFDADVADTTQHYRESREYRHGNTLGTFSSPWGSMGVAVCYDLRFPELFVQLSHLQCSVIFVPAAFTHTTGRAHWEVLLRARAIENQCFIVAANQGGSHPNGRETWGQSMIVNPWGEIMSKLGKGEGIVVAHLDLTAIETTRQQMPMAQHRRFKIDLVGE